MKKKHNCCVTWVMAMWNLICNHVSSMTDFRDRRNKSTMSALPEEVIINNHVISETDFGDERNTSTILSLPEEVIINILSRVPAESVLACRVVCLAWHRMTSTTQFTEMHLIRSTPVILGRAIYNHDLVKGWFFIDNFRFTEVKVTGVEFLRQACKPCVQAVCDGLIIFRNSIDRCRYVICNPITREEVAFCLRKWDEICGFYFHRVEEEYTLLICQKNDKNKYSVYGLSSKDRRILATSANFNLDTCGVSTCGALFWRTSDCNKHNSLTVNTESILMFNLDSESFTVKDQPTDRYKREARTQVKLLEIDEKLGCCDVYQKSVQIWILEDVDNWRWCKRYVVDLSGFTNIYGDGDMPDAKICVVATQNGNMLLFRRYVGLLWYNLGLNKVSKINTDTLDMTRRVCFPVTECDCVSITSSLVSLRKCNILPESPTSSVANAVIIGVSTTLSLPEELIINILSRVPAESVLACRKVCSAWHRMTSTTQFTDMHRIRSTPVILGRALKYGSHNWFSIDNFRFTQLKMTGVEFLREACKPCVQAVCDGLIIFRKSINRYVICNPITREEVAFRLSACDEICGFYLHRVEKEYTLLICKKYVVTNKYSVYGLSSKHRRRLAATVNFNLDTSQVATCGALFWCNSDCKDHNSLTVYTESIIMFNVDSENFMVKDQPADRYKREGRSQVKLLEIDEKLGCCDVYQKSVQVWILEDIENWKWCKRYVVDLNGFLNDYVDQDMPGAKTCVVATQNGNLLLFQSNVGLLWYNLGLNQVTKINTDSLDIVGLFPVSECDGVSITSSFVSLRERNILPESPSRPAN